VALIQPKKTLLKKQRKLNNSLIKPANFKPVVLACMLAFAYGYASGAAAEEPLITSIPKTNYAIPPGDLSEMLPLYASQAGVLLGFEPGLTVGKTTKGLKGEYGLYEGFSTLLKGSGLEVVQDEKGGYTLIKAVNKSETNLNLEEVQVRAKRFYEIGPLPGLGLTKNQIPGNVQSITAKEIKDSHSLSMSDLFNKKLQSVTVNDYQGNPFQMDVQYRGFTAGPQIGTPQGLSVFFDGVRVNEPFGDVVNWDMIPMNAIANVDVFPGSNPVFGLNTLGGAFTLKTKDGFNNEGIDAEILAGSYGRKQLQVEGGVNNGTFALFGAGNFFMEDGWRENSPSEVNQFFGKASYRGDKLDLNLSTLLVGTDLVGNGLLPSEEYARDRNASFTSEDTTKNKLQQFQLSAAFQANDNFSVTGQAYRRNSDRHQIGADVFRDYDEYRTARRMPAAGEELTCVYRSTPDPTDGSNPNQYGIPDYLVVPVNLTTNGGIPFAEQFTNDFFLNNGVVDLDGAYASGVNAELPSEFVNAFKEEFKTSSNLYENSVYNKNYNNVYPVTGPTTDYDIGSGSTYSTASYSASGLQFASSAGVGYFNSIFPGENVIYDGSYYFMDVADNGDVFYNAVFFKPPINADKCNPSSATANTTSEFYGPYNIIEPGELYPRLIDGFALGQPGYVEGTPTAIITDNKIKQVVDGGSIQLNWNFEKHKFMVGASIDAASAIYQNEQRLGFLDANRNAFLAPDMAHPQFAIADIPISNNDFSGTNTTKSLYFSEAWSPVDAWNFNVSGRYNETQTVNKIASRWGIFNYGPGDVLSLPDVHSVCSSDEECDNTPRNFRTPVKQNNLDPAETEKFSYYSFNPSVGATWQAKENLNVYANWAKGTRTPSVIELGCALDDTPNNPPNDNRPRSVAQNRQCNLPTTLSGDPFLEQIKATTYDIGLRGTISESLQWNLGAYQTDLKDDIYFIALQNGAGFFDTVGKTRRRGIEAGLSGQKDKWGFSVNYSLTDATFEDNFLMYSEDNSSSFFLPGYGNGVIEVEPGSRMPGVPLHNLNATVSYAVTPKWTVGLTAIAHSESIARGNENNKHKKGVIQVREFSQEIPGTGIVQQVLAERQPTTNPGKLPGYATFNFQTSYQFNSEWTASMLVNNVFDKEFFSAGRLGRNPFSPSILGAIGPDGYNHNSGDWRSTNFIAPSAPRGVWFSLNWRFDANKKPAF